MISYLILSKNLNSPNLYINLGKMWYPDYQKTQFAYAQ